MQTERHACAEHLQPSPRHGGVHALRQPRPLTAAKAGRPVSVTDTSCRQKCRQTGPCCSEACKSIRAKLVCSFFRRSRAEQEDIQQAPAPAAPPPGLQPRAAVDANCRPLPAALVHQPPQPPPENAQAAAPGRSARMLLPGFTPPTLLYWAADCLPHMKWVLACVTVPCMVTL